MILIGNTIDIVDRKHLIRLENNPSILGPLLFNLFINDLTYSVDDAKLRRYVEDKTLYLSHPNQDVLESRSHSKFHVLKS